jgi:glycosyltransferase involved in cell wall biosynthesis
MSVWLLVSGDFTTHGGMDMANYALASFLARRDEVHVVAHRAAPELAAMKSVSVHQVARPLGMHRFGEPLLRRTAGRWQKQLMVGEQRSQRAQRVRVVANGGNVDAGDINWVHYVHAAFEPEAAGVLNGMRVRGNHRRYVREERDALRRASLVICNSRRTADDVVKKVGVDEERARVVYYGIDGTRFGPIGAEERERARQTLGIAGNRRVALFVGALGDRRKGFAAVFDAWKSLCARPDWDADLVVAGTGAELPAWRSRAADAGLEGRVTFLGFRRDMPTVVAACDLFVHPALYEAYGLAVHEALCRGLPALVSASAGVAERYPGDLRQLLIEDPRSAEELSRRLLAWRADDDVARRVGVFASSLRARTWDHMSRDIASLAEAES